MNERTTPIVIQHNTLDDFHTECDEGGVTIVRVWEGRAASGRTPSRLLKFVACQAVTADHHVIVCHIMLGWYDQLYGEPFGPSNEAVAAIINERSDEATALVTKHFEQAGYRVRGGRISTGLTYNDMSRHYWEPLTDLYEACKVAREGNS